MTLQDKTVRGKKIRRKAASLATPDASKAQETAPKAQSQDDGKKASLSRDTLGIRPAALITPFVDAVEIEWDTPALTILPITETLLTAQIIDAAPRPMAAIDALWLE